MILHERLTGFLILGGVLALASTPLLTVLDEAPPAKVAAAHANKVIL